MLRRVGNVKVPLLKIFANVKKRIQSK
jgi:hypothetical protein